MTVRPRALLSMLGLVLIAFFSTQLIATAAPAANEGPSPTPVSETPEEVPEADAVAALGCTGAGCAKLYLPVIRKSAAATAKFATLGVGASLPSGADCASRVRRRNWEPRPDNRDENTYIPKAGSDYTLVPWGGIDERGNRLFLARVDGKFTGSTDEILQWGACKWGLDEDIVRAIAVKESTWRMSTVGPNGDDLGIMQMRASVWKGSYPASRKSTAFNVDYTLARWRACYTGYITYMKQKYPSYGSGDAWGCVGAWYSGGWHNSGAEQYIGQVKTILRERRWERSNF